MRLTLKPEMCVPGQCAVGGVELEHRGAPALNCPHPPEQVVLPHTLIQRVVLSRALFLLNFGQVHNARGHIVQHDVAH